MLSLLTERRIEDQFYDEKGAVTGRFRNAVLVCKRIVSQCDSYSEKFSNVGNELFYAKKRTIANRDEMPSKGNHVSYI